MAPKHFLTLDDLSRTQLLALLARAIELKAERRNGVLNESLKNKTLAMIFDKSSTRTRVSFEAGMRQLGGAAINLNPEDTQMGRGEPLQDTARVISSMVDGIMLRTGPHSIIETMAEYSSVPVINGLTDLFHPCQLLADLQTLIELRGENLSGCTVAWVGDGNNVCHSWMNAARILGLQLKIATPEGFAPAADVVQRNQSAISLSDDPQMAVSDADVVVTDTWASMGQEDEKAARQQAFAGYCVNEELMSLAKDEAVFLHCLPAYREMEVSDAVIEGPQSAVFQAAENRLHAQKALLEILLT